jgi:hypothetical protein
MRRDAEQMLRGLLDGVGRAGEEFFESDPDGVALHMRRPVTSAEEHAVGGARDVRCQHGKGLTLP